MKEMILEADRRIRRHVRETECLLSHSLSDALCAEVYLKLENRQLSGSFKLRGVANKLLSLSEDERACRLVAASTGNHGAAFAHTVSELGLDGLLFLPTTVTATKLRSIEASGIPFQLMGQDCVETETFAAGYAADNGCVWVSPYNDPLIVAGQGTVAVELLGQVENVDCVLGPVGGGGLMSGVATHLKAAAPGTRVIGCQPAASAVMYESVQAGEIVTMESLPTLSDATAGGIEPGSITFDICRRQVDEFALLDEDQIARAIRFVHNTEGLVIEGGAALPVAAVLQRPEAFRGKRLVLIITGSKIDDEVLRRILA